MIVQEAPFKGASFQVFTSISEENEKTVNGNGKLSISFVIAVMMFYRIVFSSLFAVH